MAEDHSATELTGLRIVSRAGWRITSSWCLDGGKHSLNCLIIIRVGKMCCEIAVAPGSIISGKTVSSLIS